MLEKGSMTIYSKSPNLNGIQICVKYGVWGATHDAIWKPSSEAQNSFWIKSRTGEDIGQFFEGPINETVPSFRNSLIRVRER